MYNSDKEQVNESPSIQYIVYSIDSLAPRTSVRIRQSGRIGEGVSQLSGIRAKV